MENLSDEIPNEQIIAADPEFKFRYVASIVNNGGNNDLTSQVIDL